MKKFNLENALKGHPVITRDKRQIIAIHLFENISELGNQNLLVVLKNEPNYSVKFFTKWYNKDGSDFGNDVKSPLDLFMYEDDMTRYANVYMNKEGNFLIDDIMYESLAEAKKSIKNKSEFIKTIKISQK